MEDQYGSDFISIVDDDGTEYELEVLTTIEYNGCTYLAVILADGDPDIVSGLEITILKSVEEDGETILTVVEDEEELNAVNMLIMESLYEADED
ncbi:MAG: DUF1292 domain-containing protein [Oscillospiraceae bacterium]|nr:DUF1292 domain-containing protein [Oscillospiraceae bacterium]MBQ9930081.1 DUF1292 domain-containing protein [Oscillospiraceae bacterium]